MALAGYKAPISTIEFGNNSFAVKGVSLNELAVLIQANLSDLELVFSAVKDEQLAGEFGGDQMRGLVMQAAQIAPGLVTNLIALCAVEDAPLSERVEAAAQLPLAVQIDAVLTIGKLTFEEAGGVKKFIDSLAGLTAAMQGGTVMIGKKAE